MSNVIQIKRGHGMPPKGTLAPYELGYDINTQMLYIGGINNDDTLRTDGLKVSFAGQADETDGFTDAAKTIIKSIKVDNATSAEQAAKATLCEKADSIQGIRTAFDSNSYPDMKDILNPEKKANTLHYYTIRDGYGATSNDKNFNNSTSVTGDYPSYIPVDGDWYVIHCTHKSVSEEEKLKQFCFDLALPAQDKGLVDGDNSIYFRRIYDHKIVNINNGKFGWIKVLDEENFKENFNTNYGIEVNTSGQLAFSKSIKYTKTGMANNTIDYPIILKSDYVTGAIDPIGWGQGIKFLLLERSGQPERYASIEGYAETKYANTPGLKFVTQDNDGWQEEATFTQGIFTTPCLCVGLGSRGTSNPNESNLSGVEGQLYFQVVSG